MQFFKYYADTYLVKGAAFEMLKCNRISTILVNHTVMKANWSRDDFLEEFPKSSTAWITHLMRNLASIAYNMTIEILHSAVLCVMHTREC